MAARRARRPSGKESRYKNVYPTEPKVARLDCVAHFLEGIRDWFEVQNEVNRSQQPILTHEHLGP